MGENVFETDGGVQGSQLDKLSLERTPNKLDFHECEMTIGGCSDEKSNQNWDYIKEFRLLATYLLHMIAIAIKKLSIVYI